MFIFWLLQKVCTHVERVCTHVRLVILEIFFCVYVCVVLNGVYICKIGNFSNYPLCLCLGCCRGYVHMYD